MSQSPTDSGTEPDAAPAAPPRPRPSRFPPAARWTLVFCVVMIALIVAIWPRGNGTSADPAGGSPSAGASAPVPEVPVDPAQLATARTDAGLADCPRTGLPASERSVLAGVIAPCLATGAPYDVGAGTAGTPMVVNMWAVWCAPCRRELPVLADYAARANGRVTVLAVHAKEGAASPYPVLTFLTDLGVRLPTVLDTDGRIAAALEAPRVFPSTILVRADGTVAKVLPQLFESPDELAAAVRQYLGVTT